jgi:hypothetical protein
MFTFLAVSAIDRSALQRQGFTGRAHGSEQFWLMIPAGSV